jgi:UDP-N-acetylmuramoyl-tripeptide--D-alanyl-D-alanine ligase
MLTLNEILKATGGEVIRNGLSSFTGISIDSRKIGEGELFIALKGDRFDGHDFIRAAIEKGGGALVSSRTVEFVEGKTYIHVPDTLKALHDIARSRRLKKNIRVVAVTGSNGKTTTKELTAVILGKRYRVLKNTGNLNNHIGLPLSLTKMEDEDEAVVLEMGASRPGEIKQLCDIALPYYGVLTNIGRAHLEGFGDIETVRRTKLELLDYVQVAVVNADDAFMMEGIKNSGFKGEICRYGINNAAEVYATDIRLYERGASFRLYSGAHDFVEMHPKISGMFNIYNILAAASAGRLLNIELPDIKQAVDPFEGVPMRLELKELNGISIINDVYNANPASMEEAVKELVRIKKGRAIAVLGDMLELGSYAGEAHRRIGRLLKELGIDIFIAVGPLMELAASEFQSVSYTLRASADAGELLKDIWKHGDSVLIKGSRGMNMEKVLER